MTQKSLFWFTDGFTGATGDGGAPYTQDEFANRNLYSLGEGVVSKDIGGASTTDLATNGNLEVSGNPFPPLGTFSLLVQSGVAILRGFAYESTALETLSEAIPSIDTTGGRVVLQADYSAATVRLLLKTSADGVAALPALTQTAGVVWEFDLATFTVDTGGTVTLTDARAFASTPLALIDGVTLDRLADNKIQIADGGVGTAKIADDAVGTAQIANNAVGTVQIANNAVGTAQIANNAVGTAQLIDNSVGTAQLINTSVGTAKIADDSVTFEKAGTGLPYLRNRQGGSATDWRVGGTSNYLVGNVVTQAGVVFGIIPDGENTVAIPAITFPVAFSQNPIVFTTVRSVNSGLCAVVFNPDIGSATNITLQVRTTDGENVPAGDTEFYIHWLAIGTE